LACVAGLAYVVVVEIRMRSRPHGSANRLNLADAGR
jgi:hypothetical protein